MRLISFAAVLCLMWFASCNSNKQQKVEALHLDSKCIPIIETFFARVAANHYREAIDSLLALNPFISSTDSTANNLRDKFSNINDLSGKFTGYKLIKKREIESDVAIYSYLVKYERKFYRFVFLFYKAADSPTIYKFTFDDTIEIELEESLKLYM